jgi:diacylglycerol kinase (ATP)
MARRWTAIVNPSAGSGRVTRALSGLSNAFAALDADVDIRVSERLEDARDLAIDAVKDHRGIVACGGDGTVAELAGVAAEHDAPLAIVPLGSGNDFARSLGIDTKRPSDAVALLTSGVEQRCDLGRVNGRWFTSVANTGFDSEANRWANGVTAVSGTPLYVLATLRTLVSYTPHRFRLMVDGNTTEHRAWLLAVGNGNMYAGGMRITPDASLHDGRLDVTIVAASSRATFLRNFPKVFSGTHVEHRLVTQLRGSRIVIESLDDSVPIEIYASGERIGPLPAELEVARDALRVMLPQ